MNNKTGVVIGILMFVYGIYLMYVDMYPLYQFYKENNLNLLYLGFGPLTAPFAIGITIFGIGFVMIIIYSLEGKSLMNPYK